MTDHDLIAWALENQGARIRYYGIPGSVSTQTTTSPDGGKRVSVRLKWRGESRNKYRPIINLDRLEIKVGNRFKPADEVIG